MFEVGRRAKSKKQRRVFFRSPSTILCEIALTFFSREKKKETKKKLSFNLLLLVSPPFFFPAAMRASSAMKTTRFTCGGASSSSINSKAATAPSPSTTRNFQQHRLPSPLRLLPSSSSQSRQQRPLLIPPRSTPDEELEAQMEEFLKKQAEIEGSGSVGATATATVEQVGADAAERGGALAGPGGDEGAVLGAAEVSDDVRCAVEIGIGVMEMEGARECGSN